MQAIKYIFLFTLLNLVLVSCSKKIATVANDQSIVVKLASTTKITGGVHFIIASEDFKPIWSDTMRNNSINAEIRVPKEGFYYVEIAGKVPGGAESFGFIFSRAIYLSDKKRYEIDWGNYDQAGSNLPVIKSNAANQKLLTAYEDKYYKISGVLKDTINKYSKLADSLFAKDLMPGYREAWKKYLQFTLDNYHAIEKYKLNYAAEHPNSIIAAYQLRQFTEFRNNYALCSKVYAQFPPDIKRTIYAQDFLKKMYAATPLLDGKAIPDVVANDLDGNGYQPGFTKHKLTLVNFWMPNERVSREEMAEFIPIYNTYKDNGFNIVSICLTADTTLWKNAVKQDKFNWPQHYSDGRDIRQSEIAKRLDIHFVPQNYLIDQQGIIVTKNIENDSLLVYLKQM